MKKKIDSKITLNISLFLISVTSSILLAEFICRIFFKVPELKSREVYPVFENDEELRWRLKKSFRYQDININSQGFRGKELTDDNHQTINILAIGDSHTFGMGVSDAMSYPAQLSVILEKHTKKSINVFNAGIPGYNSEQVLKFYKRISKNFEFNLILLGIVIDDILSEIKSKVNNDGYPIASNVASLRKKRILTESLKQINRFLKQHSHLVRFFTSRFPGLLTKLQIKMGLKESSLKYYISKWRDKELIEKEFQILREFKKLSCNKNSLLILVIFADPNQLIFNYGFDEYQKKLISFARDEGIPSINLFDTYKPVYLKKGYLALFIYNDGHPNENGYKVIAEYIANFIAENNFIK